MAISSSSHAHAFVGAVPFLTLARQTEPRVAILTMPAEGGGGVLVSPRF